MIDPSSPYLVTNIGAVSNAKPPPTMLLSKRILVLLRASKTLQAHKPTKIINKIKIIKGKKTKRFVFVFFEK